MRLVRLKQLLEQLLEKIFCYEIFCSKRSDLLTCGSCVFGLDWSRTNRRVEQPSRRERNSNAASTYPSIYFSVDIISDYRRRAVRDYCIERISAKTCCVGIKGSEEERMFLCKSLEQKSLDQAELGEL